MANPWVRLRGILPGEAVQVGQVVSDGGDGTYRIDLVGGGTVTASGSGYSAGQAVFVRSGRIESQAPSLSVVDIEV